MKISSGWFSSSLLFTLAIIAFTNQLFAQSNGIIPLTGLRYFKEGIEVKHIEVKVDGALLLNNRVQANKEIEIKLQQVAGFIADNQKKMFAGAEVMVLSPRGEILLNNPNVFLASMSSGFYAKDLESMSVKCRIGFDLLRGNLLGTIKIRLYDMKGKNQLRLELPVNFVKPGEQLHLSKNCKNLFVQPGIQVMINGLQIKDIQVKMDTSIKVAPNMVYMSIDMSNIAGSNLSEIFQGKEKFWVYNNDLQEVKINDILLKKVEASMNNNGVNYTLKIPYCVKTADSKQYSVRYRWDSPDKSKIIDVVVNN